MNYPQAVEFLDRHITLGVQPGLERITSLLEDMGRPDQGYPIIHVAGTNGKTSTSRLSSLLLVGHGLATGTYISPHLEVVEERLSVNGRYSTKDEFALAVSDVAAFADLREARGADPNTYFELTTAAAFAFFADQAVEAAVVEVGLGGRLDATNVLDAEVCVLTSIGVEHTEYLGEDVAGIAGEKLAIAGPNAVLVSGPLPDEALDVAERTARDLGIHHRQFGRDFSVPHAEPGLGGWLASVEGAEDRYDNIFLPLHGRYQLTNLAVSIAATEALLGRRLDGDAVREAAAVATMPGRMEPVAFHPLLMIDGAHNSDGVATLVDSLLEEYPTTRWQLLLGVMGDKNVELMVELLAPLVDSVVTTAVEESRAVPPDELAKRVSSVVDLPVEPAPSVAEGIEMVRQQAGPEGAVLVTGSIYLVGEVRSLLVDSSSTG